MLEFDDLTHTYRYGGVVVPSVTGMLRDAGLIDSTWFTPESAERGTFIHKAIALDTKDDLAEDSMDDDERGYVLAARKFRTDCGLVPVEVEGRVYHETYRYAGTFDLRAKSGSSYPTWLVDYKSGVVAPWTELQLAGYAACIGGAHRRFGVELRPNGDYRMTEFQNHAAADAVWRAICTVNLWKRANL